MSDDAKEWSSAAYENFRSWKEKKVGTTCTVVKTTGRVSGHDKWEYLLQNSRRKPRGVHIPTWAGIDLREYPLLVRFDFAALFLSVISLCVPFWGTVSDTSDQTV